MYTKTLITKFFPIIRNIFNFIYIIVTIYLFGFRLNFYVFVDIEYNNSIQQ